MVGISIYHVYNALVTTVLTGKSGLFYEREMGKLAWVIQLARTKYQGRRSLVEPVERKGSCTLLF